MSTDHLFQLALLAANVISGLAWFAIRREIVHVRELLTLRLDHVEERLKQVESQIG